MSDHVIVGAGSTGCVPAARLSEAPDVDVVLVEAGPPDTADGIHINAPAIMIAEKAADNIRGRAAPTAGNVRLAKA